LLRRAPLLKQDSVIIADVHKPAEGRFGSFCDADKLGTSMAQFHHGRSRALPIKEFGLRAL